MDADLTNERIDRRCLTSSARNADPVNSYRRADGVRRGGEAFLLYEISTRRSPPAIGESSSERQIKISTR